MLFAAAVPVAAQQPRVQDVGWLQGCWELISPDRTVEEQWTSPRAGTMLGVSRTTRGGATTDHEFVVLREQDGRLAYEAHPARQPVAVFTAREASSSRVVFENPQHDFPQRVGYEHKSSSELLAWIEGVLNGKPRRIEFPYRRAACAS